MSEFDTETASVATLDGGYAGEFSSGYTIGGGVNGGLLVAAVGRACAARLADVGHTQPLTVSAVYPTAAAPGPFTVTTETVRQGRSSSVLQASLRQDVDGEAMERVRGLATFGRPTAGDPAVDGVAPGGDGSRPTLPRTDVPDIPPIEDCVSHRAGLDGDRPVSAGSTELLDRVDLRLDPASAGFAVGRPSGRGVIQAWMRLADGRDPDPLALLFVVDALPPVTFDLGMPGWAPTVELTAYVRGVPAPGWLCVRHETRHVADGHFEEDAQVWDSTGRLVAQSRQLARLPRVLP